MGSLELWYAAGFRRFMADVSIAIAASPVSGGTSFGNAVPASLVVDSGSNVTVLSEELAWRLGVEIDELETRELGGVTGVARRPFVRNVEVFLGPADDGAVHLPGVAIARADARGPGGRHDPAPWSGSLMGSGLSILGTDVARALGARLMLDFARLKGTLEW